MPATRRKRNTFTKTKRRQLPRKLKLDNSEVVLFTGNYNINDQHIDNITYLLLPEIDANRNGYNAFIGNYYNVNDSKNSRNLLLEYNNITSYLPDMKTKIGQIQFTGLDMNKTKKNVASVKLRAFDVNSSSGIYANVTKVVINNYKPRRIIYFIGKK